MHFFVFFRQLLDRFQKNYYNDVVFAKMTLVLHKKYFMFSKFETGFQLLR